MIASIIINSLSEKLHKRRKTVKGKPTERDIVIKNVTYETCFIIGYIKFTSQDFRDVLVVRFRPISFDIHIRSIGKLICTNIVIKYKVTNDRCKFENYQIFIAS